LIDLRVDFDQRRQGIATVLVYQLVQQARERELRAVSAEIRTNNLPANRLLQKLSFEIAGIDTHRYSNHDLVKESATIFWYAELD
jgi:ribosomal protein S18 acetylase RimI-like enzyme